MRIGELRVASAVAGLFVLLDDFAIRIWCCIMFSSVLMNQLVLICKNLHSVLTNLLTNKLFALVLIAMVTTTVTFPPIESLKLITLEL